MPRKTVNNQRSAVKKANTNDRVKPIVDGLTGTEEAFEVMAALTDVLTPSPTPIPGKTYVFEYYAAKPELLYDRYPFVTVTGVYEWGFSGINRHLKANRNYIVGNAGTQLYEIKQSEINSVNALPLMELIQN